MSNLFRGLAALLVPAIVLIAAPEGPQNPPSNINIGDPAPPLSVKWIKGGPITKFEPEMMYVVEFWATWCSPCRAAMPHLSELAVKYKGKMEFIGVNVFEGHGAKAPYEDYLPKVKTFVEKMGDKMAYNVAMDTNTLSMTHGWMEASNQLGIPASFLVKDGKIIWIGHPSELDKVIEDVIQGRYDMEAFAKSFIEGVQKERSAEPIRREFMRDMETVGEALKKKDYPLAQDLLEKAENKFGNDYRPHLQFQKMSLYARIDPRKFIETGRQFLERNPKIGLVVADVVLRENAEPLPEKSYLFALSICTDALKKETNPNLLASIHSTRAEIFDRMGQVKKAIAEQNKAVQLARGAFAKTEQGANDREMLDDCIKRLETYRKKVKNPLKN